MRCCVGVPVVFLPFNPDVPAGPDMDGVAPASEDQSQSTDSEDCIIQAQTAGRKVGVGPLRRLRSEAVCPSAADERLLDVPVDVEQRSHHR